VESTEILRNLRLRYFFLGFYAAYNGNCVQTFWDNI